VSEDDLVTKIAQFLLQQRRDLHIVLDAENAGAFLVLNASLIGHDDSEHAPI
jgi:hypothetical protein